MIPHIETLAAFGYFGPSGLALAAAAEEGQTQKAKSLGRVGFSGAVNAPCSPQQARYFVLALIWAPAPYLL